MYAIIGKPGASVHEWEYFGAEIHDTEEAATRAAWAWIGRRLKHYGALGWVLADGRVLSDEEAAQVTDDNGARVYGCPWEL